MDPRIKTYWKANHPRYRVWLVAVAIFLSLPTLVVGFAYSEEAQFKAILDSATPTAQEGLTEAGTATTAAREQGADAAPSPCDIPHVYCNKHYVIPNATITAFNTIEAQTDSSPCIAANGENICGRTNVVACPTRLPFGTVVVIDGQHYTCVDRLARRYQNQDRFDISFGLDIKGAKQFGKQIKNVVVYE